MDTTMISTEIADLGKFNRNARITDHFTYGETITTVHRNIDNIPVSGHIYPNLLKTAVKMELIRSVLGNKIITVNSWYRSPKLNAAVGGSKNSDHMTGCAVDFVCYGFGNPLAICKKLIEKKVELGFKQLILEHTWVHISWDHIPNVTPKLQVLSLLANKKYAVGLTDKNGVPYK